MAKINVAVPHGEFVARCKRHSQVIAGLPQVEAKLQKLLAELVMMRLFDEFQESISGIALRLACGAPYADGRLPNLLTSAAASTIQARDLFENHGRPKRKFVKWSRADYINDTTKYVIDRTDPFTVTCSGHGVILREMQAIRNRIAHNNKSSRAAFSAVVQRRYGAKLNHVTPGLLLLTPRFTPTLLDQYLLACQIISKSCARA